VSNRYLSPTPLPFNPDGVHPQFDEGYTHSHVVQPSPPTGTRVDPDHIDHAAFGTHHRVDQSNRPYVHDEPRVAADDYDNCDHSDAGGNVDHNHHGSRGGVSGDDRAAKRELLRREKFDREATRVRRQHRDVDGRRLRTIDQTIRSRRRSPSGPRDVDVDNQRRDQPEPALRVPNESRSDAHRDRGKSDLPVRDQRQLLIESDQLATKPHFVRRTLAGPLNGAALALYILLLPYVVVTRWNLARHDVTGDALRGLLIVLALFWVALLVQMVRNVRRIRRGLPAGVGGSAWLAGLVVALMPFLAMPSTGSSHHRAPPASEVLVPAARGRVLVNLARAVSHAAPTLPHPSNPMPTIPTMSVVPLALMAKRRTDLLRQHQFTDTSLDVDQTIELLRGRRPDVIAHIRGLTRARNSGVLDVADDLDFPETIGGDEACVACYLGPSPTGSLVGFASEGGRLPIRSDWSDVEIRGSIIALHEGRVIFTETPDELVRALATRSIRHALVVYLGTTSGLDAELAACCITLTTLPADPGSSSVLGLNPAAATALSGGFAVRVSLLQADPSVVGLGEPFTPTLRRRCLEMLAYLAMHRHEPVTGERLRARVLTYAEVDASSRTLANTASAVRRSLGADATGPRLHAVTSSGLYVTHGVTSDLEEFTNLVSRARRLSVSEAAPLAHQALAMIKGEPLSSVLRGYEWFLAEGFGARLSRDGEWAALLVHHDALAHDRYELAYWALQQGRLIDPYSAVLLEEMARVPRLREFGSNGTDVAQDQAVRAGGAVAMSWALNGFRNQITK